MKLTSIKLCIYTLGIRKVGMSGVRRPSAILLLISSQCGQLFTAPAVIFALTCVHPKQRGPSFEAGQMSARSQNSTPHPNWGTYVGKPHNRRSPESKKIHNFHTSLACRSGTFGNTRLLSTSSRPTNPNREPRVRGGTLLPLSCRQQELMQARTAFSRLDLLNLCLRSRTWTWLIRNYCAVFKCAKRNWIIISGVMIYRVVSGDSNVGFCG